MNATNPKPERRPTHKASLETPRSCGYRTGMTAAGVIGSHLSRVYDVAGEVPWEMGAALFKLDGKVR